MSFYLLISLKNWFHGIFFNLPEVVPDFKFKGASIMIFGTNSHHFTVSLFLNLEDILFSLRRQVQ